jgi:hypothetical protein
MNHKRLVLLIILVFAVASLFFFSSWTNARVVDGESVSSGLVSASKFFPLFVGALTVIAVGVLVGIIFE